MSKSQTLRTTLGAALIAAAALFTLHPAPALAQAASELAAEPAAAPMPAAEPAPPAMAPMVEKQEIANPYGLEALWGQGDIVARSTLVIMLIMSMASWYVIFTKLWNRAG